MQTKTRSAPSSREDVQKLSSTLTRLLMPTWLRQAGMVIGVLILWYWISQQILRLGGLIRYDGLKTLGPEFVRIMTTINPYLWWGVVVIVSLIVLSVLRHWLIQSTKRSKTILVPVADIQKLSTTLSTQAVAVLQWVWDENANPISIGDLQATRRELRSGRIRKLAMAQAQAHALAQALTPTPADAAQSPSAAAPSAATREFWEFRSPRTEPGLHDNNPPDTSQRTEPML